MLEKKLASYWKLEIQKQVNNKQTNITNARFRK
jgi:hypothetical protein